MQDEYIYKHQRGMGCSAMKSKPSTRPGMAILNVNDLTRHNPRHNPELEEFILDILGEHRTNQASAIRSIQYILHEYADRASGHTDERNRAAHDFAAAVAKIDIHIPFI